MNIIFKETVKFTNDTLFGELLPSMLTLIYGKMKHLDVLYGARAARQKNVPYPDINDIIKTGTYDKKYSKFKDCLVMHLSKKSQLDVKESKRVVDSAMSVYLSKRLKKGAGAKMKGILGYYLRLPDWIDKRTKTWYKKLFLLKRMGDFPSVDISSSKYYNDFNKIRRYVLFYSKK